MGDWILAVKPLFIYESSPHLYEIGVDYMHSNIMINHSDCSEAGDSSKGKRRSKEEGRPKEEDFPKEKKTNQEKLHKRKLAAPQEKKGSSTHTKRRKNSTKDEKT